MESYAIVQASGKQFWVEENKFYDFDKLPLDRGDTFTLNQILLVNLYILTFYKHFLLILLLYHFDLLQ